jgi:hypothetical protein
MNKMDMIREYRRANTDPLKQIHLGKSSGKKGVSKAQIEHAERMKRIEIMREQRELQEQICDFV